MLKGYTIIEVVESGCLLHQQHSCARLITLRCTRCNIVILMTVTAWLILSSGGGNFLWRHLKSTVHESNPHTTQELKDNISHAVAAIKIIMLHRLYLNMIRRAQLCVDAGGNHFHLL